MAPATVVSGMQCLGARSFISRQEGASDSPELDTAVVPEALNCLSAGRSRVHSGMSAVGLSG